MRKLELKINDINPGLALLRLRNLNVMTLCCKDDNIW